VRGGGHFVGGVTAFELYAKIRGVSPSWLVSDLQPIWVLGHLDLRRDDGSITRMSSASIGPAFVTEMLSNFAHLNQTIDTFPPEQLATGVGERPRLYRIFALAVVLLATVFIVRIFRRRPRDGA